MNDASLSLDFLSRLLLVSSSLVVSSGLAWIQTKYLELWILLKLDILFG